jgi:16S rRNA (cytosine967-C5)-methyltransferase
LAAARVLDAVVRRGRSLKAELARVLPALDDPRDRALVEAICFAALRQRHRYEAALRGWMPRPLGARDGELQGLLLAGLAQLDALALPAHAALSATVDAARALHRERQAGMVNALLRRAQREGVPAADPAEAWPDWLRDKVAADWPEQAAGIFAASAQPAPLWLRANRRRGARGQYLARLEAAGIPAVTMDGWPDALRIDVPVAMSALPGFADGEVSVQDASAQAVAEALLPLPPGARVLDACAAPGGKAAHLLERVPGLRLTALDVDERRLRRVHDTLARLGLAGDAVLKAADAAEPAAWWDGVPFDAILLDAPCSATGVVRRQPDILLHRRPADLVALLEAQARLLDALWPLLAPGGVLVYATCSILKDENESQIERFLKRWPDARVQGLAEAFGHDRNVGRQRLPGEQGADGFFCTRLHRTSC